MGTMVVFGSLGLGRFGYAMVLPAMQTALGMDNTQAGMLATVNLGGYLLLAVIGGALAARYGPRIIITGGLALVGLGMMLTGLANSFLFISLWRIISGVGSGASNVPVMGLMSAWFAPKKRGFAAGITATGSSLALMVLGPIVPRILSLYMEDGWRFCWYGFGGAVLVLSIMGYLILRNHPSELGLKSFCAEPDVPLPQKESPKWKQVYSSPTVWHLGLVYIAFGFSYIIYMTFFAKHLIADGGYTKEGAGRLFMVMGWFSLLCGFVWGMVSDKIGRKWALTIIYLIHAVAFSLFGLWVSPIGLTISALLFGLTAWSIPAIMAATCGDVLGPRMSSAALGFITLFFGIGQAVAPSIAGIIADKSGSLSPAFVLAGGVSLLGAAGSYLLKLSRDLKVEG